MRRTAAIMVSAAAALVVPACGASSDSSASESAPTTVPSTEPATVPTPAVGGGVEGEGGADTLERAIRSGLEASGLEVTDLVVTDDVATVTLASVTPSQRAVACSAVGSFVGTTVLVVDDTQETC